MTGTVVALGLANWVVTLILVEGFVFEWYREGLRMLRQRALTRRQAHRALVLQKWAYLAHCQLCTGVWVGWALALVVPGPWHWVITGLVYKAIGHLTLELTAAVKSFGQAQEARACLPRQLPPSDQRHIPDQAPEPEVDFMGFKVVTDSRVPPGRAFLINPQFLAEGWPFPTKEF